ncbi:GlcG/HbpS family heme-binding protein [Schumannella soli]|uniref:Heme-binding protein n=1 Tax=Schumannella soli TaxID=2590779 RepID=A0A506Y024_9MICO|nr:heme-binding protein [Schumannella soli]TPW74827.1 heme-binding protein [Schumannella soli]
MTKQLTTVEESKMTYRPEVHPRHVRVLAYAEARVVLDAALAEAERIGVPASVAVLDAGREPLAFGRQDGAGLLTGEVATGKAFTAISLGTASGDLSVAANTGGDFAALHHATSRNLVTFAGGFPLVDAESGNLVGAIGASGGSLDEDIAIAQAGVAAFLELAR